MSENGSIRIGAQPFLPAIFLPFTPNQVARKETKNKANHLSKFIDRKMLIPGVTIEMRHNQANQVTQAFRKSLDKHGDYYNKRLCDYTGVQLLYIRIIK